eukprot:COSAG01_NODE_3761_length_5722_cov_2.962298_2_plen_172_part_00
MWPPIDAPCTHCLRHGDPMHARKARESLTLRPGPVLHRRLHRQAINAQRRLDDLPEPRPQRLRASTNHTPDQERSYNRWKCRRISVGPSREAQQSPLGADTIDGNVGESQSALPDKLSDIHCGARLRGQGRVQHSGRQTVAGQQRELAEPLPLALERQAGTGSGRAGRGGA